MNIVPVLDRAKQIADAQGRLADSPAEYDATGKLTLCAGSCIAKAILEAYHDQDALKNFERMLVTEDKLRFIPGIFQKYGFDPEKAKNVIKENDLRNEPGRSQWFRSLSHL